MKQKSKQLEALLQGVIPATPEKQSASTRPAKAEPKGSTPNSAKSARIMPLNLPPAPALDWSMEERESFDCPVIVKRHLARLAVDQPDLCVRGLYLQAVAQTYGIEIPFDVLRDRRRKARST